MDVAYPPDEILVPISLNMSIEGYEIHDAFTWNLRGNTAMHLLLRVQLN